MFPLERFGPNWIIAENQPCQLYNPEPEPAETVTWSGGCVDGKASGEGRWVWRSSEGNSVYDGGVREGKAHGYGTFTTADGDRYEGKWRNDEPHGHGIHVYSDGSRYEGEWRNGQPNRFGTFIWPDGERHEGEWRDGCFGEKDAQWAAVHTTATACGFE